MELKLHRELLRQIIPAIAQWQSYSSIPLPISLIAYILFPSLSYLKQTQFLNKGLIKLFSSSFASLYSVTYLAALGPYTYKMAKLLIFLGCISLIASVNCQGPMVEVEQGMVEGKTVPFQDDFIGIDENIDVFLGIPFAEPPLGERRFMAPIPKAPWAEGEVYDATYYRDVCVQTSYESMFFTESEDCLHLNVYAPNPKVSCQVASLLR